MLIRFTVTRRDTGAGVPNARIEVEKAEAVGVTDSQGKAELVTYWSGNWIYSVTAPGYDEVSGTLNNRDIPVLAFSVSLLYSASPPPEPPVFNDKPGEPYPPATGESYSGSVGTRCDIMQVGAFGRVMFLYRDRYSNFRSNIDESRSKTVSAAENNPACFYPAPPTPASWQDGIQKQVTAGFDALSKYVTDGLKSVTESWQNGILDLETRLKAWIQNTILDVIWTALTTQGRK
jgi:hypothetical protein